jgi:hypothetical protein
MTINTSAIEPFVMKILEPFSTQPSPSRRARHLMAPASDPASGSVMAMAPIHSPVHSFGR